MAHARTPGDWALGAFAAVGPSAAVALLTAGTFGLGAVAIAGSGLTTTATTTTAAAPLAKFADYLFREGGLRINVMFSNLSAMISEIQRNS